MLRKAPKPLKDNCHFKLRIKLSWKLGIIRNWLHFIGSVWDLILISEDDENDTVFKFDMVIGWWKEGDLEDCICLDNEVR